MNTYAEIDKEKLREILNANWMTHDATWFALCAKKFGMAATNDINRQAVRAMALTEAKRLKKALGIRTIASFAELRYFLSSAFEIIRASFMSFSLEFPEENVMVWKVPRCFAHDGLKRLGLIGEYQCGIIERLFGWFDALGINYSLTPMPSGCNMFTDGKCEMTVRFDFSTVTPP